MPASSANMASRERAPRSLASIGLSRKVRLTAPIEFQSIDTMPVDLVFMILSPPDAGAEHLKALARVSRTLRDKPTLAKLRGARSRDAMFALLAGIESLNAA